jgi:hypothetical protein
MALALSSGGPSRRYISLPVPVWPSAPAGRAIVTSHWGPQLRRAEPSLHLSAMNDSGAGGTSESIAVRISGGDSESERL